MLIARRKEKALLASTLGEEYSQFVAVYGRRRVGKTFLVRESFDYSFTFQHAGLAGGNRERQLFAFSASLKEAGLRDFEHPRNWLEAFELLKDLVRASSAPKKVLFIDELSWMDTPKSDLMIALEGFWNGWASARKDIVLVVCASATSWMINKVVHNKGGLYNRLTRQIHLEPFTLGECEEYARAQGIAMNRHQLLECYMIMGGVPYYWGFLQKSLSLSQNIDAMFFAKGAPLANEFDYLYASLFKNPAGHLAVVAALGAKKAGMSRAELARETGLANSGALTRTLKELESCGFVREYRAFGKKRNGSLYQLTDNFTLFYFKFMERRSGDEHFWSHLEGTGARNAWCGLAFERVCLDHIPQMKRALGISGVSTSVNSWSCESNPDKGLYGSQIDLLIARRDQVINVCEMKYSTGEYAVTRADDEAMRHKMSDLREVTHTKCAMHFTLVTTYGLSWNENAGDVHSVITAEDLFAEA